MPFVPRTPSIAHGRIDGYDAILCNLAVIGEAVRSLPDDFKADLIRDILDNHLMALRAAIS